MPTETQPYEINRPKFLLIFLHLGFLLIGIITVLLGQILPILSTRLNLTDNQSGYFFIAQFSGSLTGVFLYNPGIRRIGFLKTLPGGFFLMGLGCLGLNAGDFLFCILSVFTYGIGIGISIPTVNMLIVELNPLKSSSSLNFINFFWGIGAILSKPYVDFIGSSESFLKPTILLSILLMISGFLVGFSKYREDSVIGEMTPAGSPPIWKTKIAWMIAIFNFINIGIESSVGGWITTYESRMNFEPPFLWLSAAFTFFLFLVVGRGVAPLFFRFLSDNNLLFCNLILITLGALVILMATGFWGLLLGVGLIGFGTSSVFPTNMSRFTKIFGSEATRKAAPIFILGSLGGAFMTWLVGFLSTEFNNLNIGFYAILGACLILLFMQITISTTREMEKKYET